MPNHYQLVLGGEAFLRKVQSWLEAEKPGQKLRGGTVRPKWAAVVAAVEEVKGEKWAEFRDWHGDRGRELAMYLGQREGGLSLRELATLCGLTSAAAAGASVTRYSRRLQTDAAERAIVERALQLLIVYS